LGPLTSRVENDFAAKRGRTPKANTRIWKTNPAYKNYEAEHQKPHWRIIRSMEQDREKEQQDREYEQRRRLDPRRQRIVKDLMKHHPEWGPKEEEELHQEADSHGF
jgi:hypothetical protein